MWRESAEIISPSILRASLAAKALLPTAVGPTMTKIFSLQAAFFILTLDDFYFSADRIKTLRDFFVAAVNHVDIAQDRHSFRAQHGDKHHHRRPESGRANYLRGFHFSHTGNVDPMRVGQGHIRSEAVEFGEVNGPVIIYPVVNEGLSFGLGGNRHKEGQVVDVDTRVRVRMDFVFRSNEPGGPDFYIHQYSSAVVREIFFGSFIFEPHPP